MPINYDGDDTQDEFDPYAYEGDDEGNGDLWSLPGGGKGLNPFYGNSQGGSAFGSSTPTFSTTKFGSYTDPDSLFMPGQSQLQFSPFPTPTFPGFGGGSDIYGLVANPKGSSGDSSPASNTTNNSSTQNTQNNTSQTNVVGESMTNALPPIAEGSPAGNDSHFESQYIPQSQRRMSPSGMDSGSRMPGSAPIYTPPLSDYDPGLSKAGNNIPSGNAQPIQTQGSQPSRANSSIGGRLLNVPLSMLSGIPAVNRFRRVMQDVRRKPHTPPDPNNPYGI